MFTLTIKTHTKKIKLNGTLHIWVPSEDFTANFHLANQQRAQTLADISIRKYKFVLFYYYEKNAM